MKMRVRKKLFPHTLDCCDRRYQSMAQMSPYLRDMVARQHRLHPHECMCIEKYIFGDTEESRLVSPARNKMRTNGKE